MPTFNYEPHPRQREVHEARSVRFRAACCGRRWGKTRLAAVELVDIAGMRGGLFAWIAPTYFIAERGERAMREVFGEFITFKGQNPRRAYFTGAGGPVEILFLSADNPDTILGEGYDGAVIDEAARIERLVWEQYIRPALADKQGWALFISTPKGRNWFYDIYERGLDPSEPHYASFTFPSNTNPYFPQAEWDEAKRTTASDIFRQEYEAAFLEDGAGVFKNIDACLLDGEPHRGGRVSIGCDLAKHTDFTWLTALDRRTGHCFAMDRFNQLEWPIQKDRIATFASKHRGIVVLDATGIGDPIYDDLRHRVPSIEPIKLTNPSKTALIQRLIVAIEQEQIAWPRAWEVLTAELRRYEFKYSSTGTITYNAPSGFHDDGVISLALANSLREEYRASSSPKIFTAQRIEGRADEGRAMRPRPRALVSRGRSL